MTYSPNTASKVFCRHSLRICKRGWKWSSCLGENMIFIFFHQLSVWIHFSAGGFFSPTLSLGTFGARDEICWSLRQTKRERERENPWIVIVVWWETISYRKCVCKCSTCCSTPAAFLWWVLVCKCAPNDDFSKSMMHSKAMKRNSGKNIIRWINASCIGCSGILR